jgi:hypothetical protein
MKETTKGLVISYSIVDVQSGVLMNLCVALVCRQAVGVETLLFMKSYSVVQW